MNPEEITETYLNGNIADACEAINEGGGLRWFLDNQTMSTAELYSLVKSYALNRERAFDRLKTANLSK